jgi:hypothetical protein
VIDVTSSRCSGATKGAGNRRHLVLEHVVGADPLDGSFKHGFAGCRIQRGDGGGWRHRNLGECWYGEGKHQRASSAGDDSTLHERSPRNDSLMLIERSRSAASK